MTRPLPEFGWTSQSPQATSPSVIVRQPTYTSPGPWPPVASHVFGPSTTQVDPDLPLGKAAKPQIGTTQKTQPVAFNCHFDTITCDTQNTFQTCTICNVYSASAAFAPTPIRGRSAPGPRWGTSFPQTPSKIGLPKSKNPVPSLIISNPNLKGKTLFRVEYRPIRNGTRRETLLKWNTNRNLPYARPI